MKKFLILVATIFVASAVKAETTQTVFNPFTGKMDYITTVAPNISPDASYSGFTFNGTDWCLYVNGVQKECWSQAVVVTINYAKLEDDTYFLTEDGNKLLLEH